MKASICCFPSHRFPPRQHSSEVRSSSLAYRALLSDCCGFLGNARYHCQTPRITSWAKLAWVRQRSVGIIVVVLSTAVSCEMSCSPAVVTRLLLLVIPAILLLIVVVVPIIAVAVAVAVVVSAIIVVSPVVVLVLVLLPTIFDDMALFIAE